MKNKKYINKFIDKYFKSIKEQKKKDLKYILKRIYEEDFRLILVLNELESKISTGVLLVPVGLLSILEKEFPFLLIDIIKELQIKKKIEEAKKND